MEERPHCWRRADEGLCICICVEVFLLNVYFFHVMCQVGPHEGRAKAAAMGSLEGRRNAGDVCSVHEPTLRTVLPGCIFCFLLVVLAERDLSPRAEQFQCIL